MIALGWLPDAAGAQSKTGVSALQPERSAAGPGAERTVHYPPVIPGQTLQFPRDHGAHPDFRTEWWYLTGWLERPGRAPCGVQITFFRSRTAHSPANPSRFAPTQLILAHVALALPERRSLLHDQRAARQGFGLAQADTDDTDVKLDGWTLRRDSNDRYHAAIDAEDFSLALRFDASRPPYRQGDNGFSRKGPQIEQASYYYSRPHLSVSGTLRIHADDGPQRTAPTPVSGLAWLDHEWSSEVLDPNATGWDWCGLNLDDGSALMAFVVRLADRRPLWSHSQWIAADGERLPAGEARFEPQRRWRSTRTGIEYPVESLLSVGNRQLLLTPLFDDQELDSRGSTGAIYWEGAVRVTENGRPIGRGYLELTGYGERLKI